MELLKVDLINNQSGKAESQVSSIVSSKALLGSGPYTGPQLHGETVNVTFRDGVGEWGRLISKHDITFSLN